MMKEKKKKRKKRMQTTKMRTRTNYSPPIPLPPSKPKLHPLPPPRLQNVNGDLTTPETGNSLLPRPLFRLMTNHSVSNHVANVSVLWKPLLTWKFLVVSLTPLLLLLLLVGRLVAGLQLPKEAGVLVMCRRMLVPLPLLPLLLLLPLLPMSPVWLRHLPLPRHPCRHLTKRLLRMSSPLLLHILPWFLLVLIVLLLPLTLLSLLARSRTWKPSNSLFLYFIYSFIVSFLF